MNLKLIDRKSSNLSGAKLRKSRITILGDSTVEYNIDDNCDAPEEDHE